VTTNLFDKPSMAPRKRKDNDVTYCEFGEWIAPRIKRAQLLVTAEL
jgi:hypothetical protein